MHVLKCSILLKLSLSTFRVASSSLLQTNIKCTCYSVSCARLTQSHFRNKRNRSKIKIKKSTIWLIHLFYRNFLPICICLQFGYVSLISALGKCVSIFQQYDEHEKPKSDEKCQRFPIISPASELCSALIRLSLFFCWSFVQPRTLWSSIIRTGCHCVALGVCLCFTESCCIKNSLGPGF